MVATREMVAVVAAVKERVAASQVDQWAQPGAAMAVAVEMEVVKGAVWTEVDMQEAVAVGGRWEAVVAIGERTWTRRVESSVAVSGAAAEAAVEACWAGEGQLEVVHRGEAEEGATVAGGEEAAAMVMETEATAAVEAVVLAAVKVETHMRRRTRCNRCQFRNRYSIHTQQAPRRCTGAPPELRTPRRLHALSLCLSLTQELP